MGTRIDLDSTSRRHLLFTQPVELPLKLFQSMNLMLNLWLSQSWIVSDVMHQIGTSRGLDAL